MDLRNVLSCSVGEMQMRIGETVIEQLILVSGTDRYFPPTQLSQYHNIREFVLLLKTLAVFGHVQSGVKPTALIWQLSMAGPPSLTRVSK